MHTRRSIAALSTVAALVVSLTGVIVAAAQGPAAGRSCAVVTADEVNAIFSGANLTLDEDSVGAGYYCGFRGGFDLTISVIPETDLEETKADFGEGEDMTVAGRPGWWQESSGNLAVAANGSVLFMNGWDSAETDGEKVALLSRLAELIVPRIPTGADSAVAARLTGLLPPEIAPDAISVIPGWYVLRVDDASTPERKALRDLLASQGRTTADLVFVFGSDGAGGSAIMTEVPGLDTSALLPLLLDAVIPAAAIAPVATVEIGGRQVTRIETEPPIFAFVSGDAVVFANGSDAFVASVIAPIPGPRATARPTDDGGSDDASPSPSAPSPSASTAAPNVRVTDIRSTFVPSVPDTDGDGCSGPYLDLRFTIANLGAAYPIADELVATQTIPLPADGYTLLVLTVWMDQFGTGENMAQRNVPVLMADVPGQMLGAGQSIEVGWRYRVPDDQTSMRFFGEVRGAHFHVTTGSTGERYQITVPIPIWDVRPKEAGTVESKADNGTPRAVSLVTLENRGASDTPGPVRVLATLSYSEAGFIGGWNGVSPFPIPAGGTVQVPGETSLVGDRRLERDRLLLTPVGPPYARTGRTAICRMETPPTTGGSCGRPGSRPRPRAARDGDPGKPVSSTSRKTPDRARASCPSTARRGGPTSAATAPTISPRPRTDPCGSRSRPRFLSPQSQLVDFRSALRLLVITVVSRITMSHIQASVEHRGTSSNEEGSGQDHR